jgi:hypothetical protein
VGSIKVPLPFKWVSKLLRISTLDIDALTLEIRQLAEENFGRENVIVTSGTISGGAFGGFALVASGNQDLLAEFNDQAIAALEEVDGLANVSSNLADMEAILRVNGEPAISFSGELETEDALGVTEAAKRSLEAIVPSGLMITEGFQSEQLQPSTCRDRSRVSTLAHQPRDWHFGDGRIDDVGRYRGDERHRAYRPGAEQPQETRDGCPRGTR